MPNVWGPFYYLRRLVLFFFFFNETATTEIYTLSLHDALPIRDPDVLRDAPRRRQRDHPQPDLGRDSRADPAPRGEAQAASGSGAPAQRRGGDAPLVAARLQLHPRRHPRDLAAREADRRGR